MPGRYTFNDAKRWLRRTFPLEYPVRVRLASRTIIRRFYEHDYELTPREQQLDDVGMCSFHKKGCLILIDATASEDAKIEHLHEEWAQERMRKRGRTDWVNLGYMEAFTDRTIGTRDTRTLIPTGWTTALNGSRSAMPCCVCRVNQSEPMLKWS